eukprot:2587172-Ditylum_brightwellii.AAC.1
MAYACSAARMLKSKTTPAMATAPVRPTLSMTVLTSRPAVAEVTLVKHEMGTNQVEPWEGVRVLQMKDQY